MGVRSEGVELGLWLRTLYTYGGDFGYRMNSLWRGILVVE